MFVSNALTHQSCRLLKFLVVSRNDHPALLTGTLTCRALSQDPFMVRRGNFQLFNQDFRSPDTTNLTYDFDMLSTSGEIIHFNGYKIVNSSIAFSPWATWTAISTLYVTLTGANGRRVGRGMMHIRPSAFVPEVLTLTPTGSSLLRRVVSSGQFLSFFVKQVAKSFLGPLNSLQWPSASYSGYFGDKVPPAKTIKVTAADGVQTTLRMWNPVNRRQPGKMKILFVAGLAVDHQVFALPTIERNAVEYFTRAGHEVWVEHHRIGKTMIAQKGYTAYDVRLDIKASLEEIRKTQSPQEKVYVVAHCHGATAFASGLLDGTIPANWISDMSTEAQIQYLRISLARK